MIDSYTVLATVSKIRTPFKHVFSKRNRWVQYRGIEKNQFAVFMQAIAFNLKPLFVLNAPPMLFHNTG